MMHVQKNIKQTSVTESQCNFSNFNEATHNTASSTHSSPRHQIEM